MDKIKIGFNVTPYPMPVSLVGANVAGRANFLAIAWLSRVNNRPPIIGITLNRKHYTAEGIMENKTFSVNFPGVDLLEKTDYCGIVSGRKASKEGLFDVFYGETETAPMISQCPLCIECRLYDTVALPTHYLFLGEIVQGYTEDRFMTQGHPDVKKMGVVTLTMPDNAYWTVGDKVGDAWKMGLTLKQGGKE